MRKLIYVTLATTALGACNVETMRENYKEGTMPFVVAVNEASVTVAAEGNYLWQSKHTSDPRTVQVAEQTCKSVGKRNAIYQSSVDSTEHYNKRNHLFLCTN